MQENNLSVANSLQTMEEQAVDNRPKANNFLVILLSILLFIALVIAGFFAYQTQNLVKELQGIRNEELATQIPIPTPTYEPGLEPELVPIEVLTKDWKTYNDSKNNISFKYPPTWAYELGETGITNGYAGFDTKILNNEKNINYFFSVNLETLPDFNNWSKYVSTKKINSQTINNKTFDKYILADMYYSLNYIYKIRSYRNCSGD